MKREFLQLCQKYSPRIGPKGIFGWYLSEKLDGMRAFWDGGVSRGVAASEVPWANTTKDYRLKGEVIATGLWSRLGKVIWAPDWWLDKLPFIPLDGELYLGRDKFQSLMSICKSFSGVGWDEVEYRVLDSPPLETVLADGVIDCRIGSVLYRREIKGAIDWIEQRGIRIETVKSGKSFEMAHQWLKGRTWNRTVKLHEQRELSYKTGEVEEAIERELGKGGEGLVLRSHVMPWKPERSWGCLKLKHYQDDEAIVIGYRWGKETELGSKLLGLMGALIVNFRGKIFELSGFTESERIMSEWEEGLERPGERAIRGTSKEFPIGSTVTFRYRELSVDGIPKEARYLRKREIG